MSNVVHYLNIEGFNGYRILYSNDPDKLSNNVIELISQGWSLLGSHQQGGHSFSQTMVKVEGPLVLK